ncbi:hypothetical protein ACYZT8_20390 [Pseudomonas sp. LB3P93]
MKVDWIEWLGRGMQLALVVLVVGGIYQWSVEASRKQEALCDVALSHLEVLEAQRGASRREIHNARAVADDACA